MHRFLFAFCLLLAGSTPAAAEKFLGVVGEDEAGEEDEGSQQRSRAKKTSSGRGDSGHFEISGGLGAGESYFNARLSITYWRNAYIGFETSGFYDRFESDEQSGVRYGPEFSPILRLANPTLVTPFAGAGLGYVKWVREDGGVVFDDAASVTANAFGGVILSLTDHFGLRLLRKQTIYLADPPRRYSDHSEREPRSRMVNEVGFRLSL